ncbi:DUF3343 domain-containing protein [Vagococcus acidifermentans]|nr:DUF3343 domain-containing protein [Vagococcus acidifermentans]
MTFPSTHDAIGAEKVLAALALPGRLVATPERISAGCGFSMKFPLAETVRIQEGLTQAGVSYAEIYRIANNRTYVRV